MWATPRVGGEESFESLQKRKGTKVAKSTGGNLLAQVEYEQMWATPNTMDHLPPRSEEATKKMQEGHRRGRSRPSNLREQVDEETMKLWPTPNAWDGNRGPRSKENLIEKDHQINLISAVKDAMDPDPVHLWPTPRARDYKDGHKIPPSIQNGSRSHHLGTKVLEKRQTSGTLNPTWVEWLMGYPKGWTDLKD
jgi:hypothetical protein